MNDVKETVVRLMDGKYELRHEHGRNFRALRYGEPWRDLTGDGMVLALVQRIEELEEATLKAAQGGVTEAINWSEFWNRISQNFDSADVDKVRACYKAALSAQQGQGEALLARVCGMVPGMSRVTLQLPSGPLPEWADLGCTVSVGEPTAPPDQPAERVPEESYRGVPYRVLGKAFQRALADPNVLWRDNGGAQEFIDRVQEETRLSLLASPAPLACRARAPEVPRRKASDYASGTYGPDDLAAIWNCCCEAHKRASPAPSPARGTAWCPKCAANQPHHTDPNSSGCLHLCDVCNSVVEY